MWSSPLVPGSECRPVPDAMSPPAQTADALSVPISAAPPGSSSRVLADRGRERVVEAMSLPVVPVLTPPDERAA
ncbi:hypothetical protein Psed_2145 [Pseudonocardia dioxanivorans CB1190]|jgi:hypothetical protein|uniref:Uncharacterized protein n=1 Tax=Pseudonocardia dioxanivorans (strain ATCC 55486 / DSM 44775 / JCM 13855 / CB1190) TaxID=675635 RepID=F4CKZ0_PSEUX|nr:hypothetical protein Psed_2145 [Pseudonocardia dioxanivorans CB1190]GJF02063.1 hypothetical protein PSD17_10270 [Pseudonocardia sp. D17]